MMNFAIVIKWDWLILFFPSLAGIEPGTLGDTFGLVNSLFSALAFSLLIWTSLMQKEELSQNTKILEMQAKEMTDQSESLRMTRKAQEENLNLVKNQLRLSVRPSFSSGYILWYENGKYYELAIPVMDHSIALLTSDISITINSEKVEFEALVKYINPGEKIIYKSITLPSPSEGLNAYGTLKFFDKVGNIYNLGFGLDSPENQSAILNIYSIQYLENS